MKKILPSALAAVLLLLLLPGCSQITDSTITFYDQPVRELDQPAASETRALTVQEVKRIEHILAGAEWTDDYAVNRFPFYFDGAFRINGVLYRFSLTEPYVIYYSHYFDGFSAEDMAYIRSLDKAK